jgi:hypothetical protein
METTMKTTEFYKTLKHKDIMEVIDSFGSGKVDSYEAYSKLCAILDSKKKKDKKNK